MTSATSPTRDAGASSRTFWRVSTWKRWRGAKRKGAPDVACPRRRTRDDDRPRAASGVAARRTAPAALPVPLGLHRLARRPDAVLLRPLQQPGDGPPQLLLQQLPVARPEPQPRLRTASR